MLGHFQQYPATNLDLLLILFFSKIKSRNSLGVSTTRKHGALEIDEINDPDEWEAYCDKEQHLVCAFLNELNAVGSIDTTMPNPNKARKLNGGTPKEYEKMLERMELVMTDSDDDTKSFDSENGKWTRKVWDV